MQGMGPRLSLDMYQACMHVHQNFSMADASHVQQEAKRPSPCAEAGMTCAAGLAVQPGESNHVVLRRSQQQGDRRAFCLSRRGAAPTKLTSLMRSSEIPLTSLSSDTRAHSPAWLLLLCNLTRPATSTNA